VLQDPNLAHHTKLAITRHQQAEASNHHQSNNPKQVQVTSHTNPPVAHSRHRLSVQESVNSQNPLIRLSQMNKLVIFFDLFVFISIL
jgi:hypothetical protein